MCSYEYVTQHNLVLDGVELEIIIVNNFIPCMCIDGECEPTCIIYLAYIIGHYPSCYHVIRGGNLIYVNSLLSHDFLG
jgi:hypothetical protein